MLRILASIVLIYMAAMRGADGQFTDTFEFGKNIGHVAFTTSGTIGLLQTTTKVPIVVPYCMQVTYVRVDIDNKLGPPKVDYDSDVSTVVIKYRFWQNTLSRYVVTAKAIPTSNCDH